jgi:hypothetical protein
VENIRPQLRVDFVVMLTIYKLWRSVPITADMIEKIQAEAFSESRVVIAGNDFPRECENYEFFRTLDEAVKTAIDLEGSEILRLSCLLRSAEKRKKVLEQMCLA